MTEINVAPDSDNRQITEFSYEKGEQKYLDDQMKKVSRSFALVVSQVEQPLREYLAIAYLICRVVDNIEDTSQPFDWQELRFNDFCALLDDPSAASRILREWGAESWPGLTDDEKRLMGPEDGTMLWRIYGKIPSLAQQIIGYWAREMTRGMIHIEDPDQAPLLIRQGQVEMLASHADYNQYCYYVAGTVGHMATQLAVEFYSMNGQYAGQLEATSEACGRGLQKTNIVKDFRKDLARGVSYLPDEWLSQVAYQPLQLAGAPASWKRLVVGDILGELREATRYVLALPYEAQGYRIASLLCLFPAYQTLLHAAERSNKLFTSDHNFKISRFTMMTCIRDARSLVHDNEAVLAYSRSAEKAIESLLE